MAAGELAPSITLYGDADDTQSRNLAKTLNGTLLPASEAPSTWHLRIQQHVVHLVDPGGETLLLAERDVEVRTKGFAQQGLGKACAVARKPKILDALGGWGTDALALAAFGCEVLCCEIHPLIYALNHVRAINMNIPVAVVNADVVDVLKLNAARYDVIYLDAMFPEHPKGAKPARSMQVLAQLAHKCDLAELLKLARDTASDRVVVKRRRKQSSELPPADWSIDGKTVRFDVYRPAVR